MSSYATYSDSLIVNITLSDDIKKNVTVKIIIVIIIIRYDVLNIRPFSVLFIIHREYQGC